MYYSFLNLRSQKYKIIYFIEFKNKNINVIFLASKQLFLAKANREISEHEFELTFESAEEVI